MANTNIDFPDELEEKITVLKDKWRINKVRTVLRIVREHKIKDEDRL